MFPCFDEPEFKAIFQLEVTNHKNFSVISNTEVQNTTFLDIKGRITTTFKPTPIMPTYNLAVLVSEFSKVTNNRTNHSIYFKSTWNPDAANFSLQLGDKILKKYQEYTNISFEINKMDLAGVPGFTGGQENWGAIFLE